MNCGFCGEVIGPGERACGLGTPLHRECQARLVIGSVAHIERRCGCYVPGSEASDPPQMTLRQGARAALVAYTLREERN